MCISGFKQDMKDIKKESVKKLLTLVEQHPEYFIKRKSKSIDDGVKEFFKKREEYSQDNKSSRVIEYNTLEIIYKSIKDKYSEYFIPGRIEELLLELKNYNQTGQKEKFNNLRNRIKILLLNIETQILTYIPDYKPKIKM